MRDAASLERLVSEHLPIALRFATRLAGDPHQAEELVQEALLRVVRSWESFRGEADFRTWLFRIIINVFRDGRRGTAEGSVSLAEYVNELAEVAEPEPAAAAMAGELEERIALEVSRLPPRQREVLVLMTFEQMTVAEVASVVGISSANVYSTLSAARAQLRTRLAPYLDSSHK